MKRRADTCGGKRGLKRKTQGHRFRREEKALPPVVVPRTPQAILDRIEWAISVLQKVPPDWMPDIDDPQVDPFGRLTDGFWTGKIYTGLRGSWCTYHDHPDSTAGTPTAVLVRAICDVVNVLPELVRLARIGAHAEAEAQNGR